MTIQIPAGLQWVAYLVGPGGWPQGDEDAMFRIGGEWRAHADDMTGLIPELNRMRASTRSALQGLTAGVADDEFKLLFDGDASVDKLAKAMAALGGLAEGTGKNIERTKLVILTSLAIAAFEISWALAQTSTTFGASAAAIPAIEMTTAAAIRQAIVRSMRQVMDELGSALTRTMVHRIFKKAGVEMAEGVGQDLFIQRIQQANGHQQGFDFNQTALVALRDAAGGAAQGTVTLAGQRAFGDSALKGAAVGYAAGVSKKVAGAVATGQPIDVVSVLGSAPTAATGAVRGRAAARNNSSPAGDGDGGAAASG